MKQEIVTHLLTERAKIGINPGEKGYVSDETILESADKMVQSITGKNNQPSAPVDVPLIIDKNAGITSNMLSRKSDGTIPVPRKPAANGLNSGIPQQSAAPAATPKQAPMTIINKATGQRMISNDGGMSWVPAQ
jgi:hypothetical protein